VLGQVFTGCKFVLPIIIKSKFFEEILTINWGLYEQRPFPAWRPWRHNGTSPVGPVEAERVLKVLKNFLVLGSMLCKMAALLTGGKTFCGYHDVRLKMPESAT